MAVFKLPAKPIMNTAFAERGRNDVVMIDVFDVVSKQTVELTFESRKSSRRQGVFLISSGVLEVNHQQSASMVFWQDTAPTVVRMVYTGENGLLRVYNVWMEEGNQSMQSQAWSSGMLIEPLERGRRYRCNDIGFDTDFDRIVFRLERRDQARI
jgi:hypothetical protein